MLPFNTNTSIRKYMWCTNEEIHNSIFAGCGFMNLMMGACLDTVSSLDTDLFVMLAQRKMLRQQFKYRYKLYKEAFSKVWNVVELNAKSSKGGEQIYIDYLDEVSGDVKNDLTLLYYPIKRVLDHQRVEDSALWAQFELIRLMLAMSMRAYNAVCETVDINAKCHVSQFFSTMNPYGIINNFDSLHALVAPYDIKAMETIICDNEDIANGMLIINNKLINVNGVTKNAKKAQEANNLLEEDELDVSTLEGRLAKMARDYNSFDFIDADPVRFPRRYTNKRDIEISAFITSWIAFGNRKNIVNSARFVDSLFKGKPYDYVMSKRWMGTDLERHSEMSMYRWLSCSDFISLCERLRSIYIKYKDLEKAVDAQRMPMVEALSSLFAGIKGVPDAKRGSACKRLCLFLRWMCRHDGIVDMGVWNKDKQSSLIIPLDTHVRKTALSLGLITDKDKDTMKTAVKITDFFRSFFPDDPALGDFALFGAGIDNVLTA